MARRAGDAPPPGVWFDDWRHFFFFFLRWQRPINLSTGWSLVLGHVAAAKRKTSLVAHSKSTTTTHHEERRLCSVKLKIIKIFLAVNIEIVIAPSVSRD
jgi:hypothetical protein